MDEVVKYGFEEGLGLGHPPTTAGRAGHDGVVPDPLLELPQQENRSRRLAGFCREITNLFGILVVHDADLGLASPSGFRDEASEVGDPPYRASHWM